MIVAAVAAALATAVSCWLWPPTNPLLTPVIWLALAAGGALPLVAAVCLFAFGLLFDERSLLGPPLSLSLSDLLLIAAFIRAWPLLVHRDQWTRRSLNPYLLLFLLVWLPSAATAVDRPLAMRSLATLVGMLATGAVTALVSRQSDGLRKLEYMFLLSALVICLFGLVQWVAYQGWKIVLWYPRVTFIPELGRQVFMVTSMMKGRHLMVMMLVAAAAIGLPLSRDSRLPGRLRAAIVGVMVFSIGIVLLSFSRSGRGVVGLILMWAALTSGRRQLALRWASAAGIAAATLFVPPQLVHVSLARVERPTAGSRMAVRVTERTNPKSTAARGRLLRTALGVIGERPLTGVGGGCFRRLWFNADKTDPHNTGLQIAVSAGLPALAAFVLLLAATMGQAAVAGRFTSSTGAASPAAAAALACLAAILVHSLFEDLIYSKVLWAAIGMASGASFAATGAFGVPGATTEGKREWRPPKRTSGCSAGNTRRSAGHSTDRGASARAAGARGSSAGAMAAGRYG